MFTRDKFWKDKERDGGKLKTPTSGFVPIFFIWVGRLIPIRIFRL